MFHRGPSFSMMMTSRNELSCFACCWCVGRVVIGHQFVEHSVVLSTQESHGITDRRTILMLRSRAFVLQDRCEVRRSGGFDRWYNQEGEKSITMKGSLKSRADRKS
jgi:hypothetical protein